MTDQKGVMSLNKQGVSENEELQQLRMIFNRVLDGIIVFDSSFQVINVNDAACQLFEQSEQKLVTYHVRDFLMMLPYEVVEEYYASITKTGYFHYEGTLTLHSGIMKQVEFTCEKKHSSTNILICTFRDITARKLLENERFISQQMFMDVFNQAVDGIVIFDRNGSFIDANPAFCKRLNYTKEQLLAKTLNELVEPAFDYKIKKLWRILHQNGTARGELPLRSDSGDVNYFEFTTTANIYSEYYMSIMRDVTEKRNMEQQLSKSEQKFREIFENAIDPIVIWKDDGTIIDANAASARTFELPLEELITQKLYSFVNSESKGLHDICNEFKELGSIRAELPFYMPNGEVKELEFTAKSDVIEDYNLTIFRNISERKKMEKELRENEQKFRQIFNGSLDGIVLWNRDRKIIDANSATCKIVEMTKEEICECTIDDFMTHDTYDFFVQHHYELEAQGEADGEILLYTRSRKKRNIEFSTKKDIIPGLYMTIIRDITEKKEMHEQIRKSDTMQVVGQLAAGIAHEIRNPMTALKGFIQLLEGSVKEDYSLYFDIIKSELQRIESIITEFLVLAKPQAVKFEKKDVKQIVKDTMELLNAQAMLENVQFVPSFEADLPSIYCESNQLKQVFINIIKNAIEVMKNGGVITIQIKCVKQRYVVVSIKDEGEGISEDRVKKLGEPFYTTKEKGTGLGLMVSYKIIEEHKGSIQVESKLGKGTTFHVALPIPVLQE
ncbi:PAS domain-containing sensor histidine kinase [Metabacillus iocasae]|uniref:histidine kinase n=1 Tax=Priestia iocasae TaxID=2291674 RepID=A0ABS2QZ57_9BACI|nr:PAS domain-containing sensor histidine kinase [Metabacillus iocasae]MBM7704774.1 two-component system, sporulation sensor kinase E [Metabacillus iocasae]